MAVILQPLGAFFRLTPLRNEWQDVELNTPLDALYLNGDKSAFKHALKAFKKDGGLNGYRLASHESIDKVMDEIAQLDPGQISPSLYESYSENLRKAVDQVIKKDNGNGLSDKLRANVSKFAAYKAYNATIDTQREMGNDWEDAKMVLRTYNRYQTTEYNTTVSRCRTAKQFEQFNDPDNRRLFPNLRWLPSRSADPRELHMLFYDRVWSKDDEFWTKNTPGSLWNCKCDWEETDDPVTDGNPTTGKSMSGLKGNPAMTGNVFSSDHPYFDYDIPQSLKMYNPALYDLLTFDSRKFIPDYFSNEGGILLTNINRKIEGRSNKSEKKKFDKEYSMCVNLAKNNYRIEYLETVEGRYDIKINGSPADLKKLKSSNNIYKKAKHAITSQGADIVIFEFENFDHNYISRLKEVEQKGYKAMWYLSDSPNNIHFINI